MRISIVGVGLIEAPSRWLCARLDSTVASSALVRSRRLTRLCARESAGRGALPLAEAAAVSDFIYLAQPIERILQTIDAINARRTLDRAR